MGALLCTQVGLIHPNLDRGILVVDRFSTLTCTVTGCVGEQKSGHPPPMVLTRWEIAWEPYFSPRSG